MQDTQAIQKETLKNKRSNKVTLIGKKSIHTSAKQMKERRNNILQLDFNHELSSTGLIENSKKFENSPDKINNFKKIARPQTATDNN